MGHKFTASGAAQFRQDMRAISSLVEHYIPDGSSSLGSLCDALQLLNLPVEAAEESALSLKQATDLAFTGNAEAKTILDQLEIDSLTPANARQILQRRVENAEYLKGEAGADLYGRPYQDASHARGNPALPAGVRAAPAGRPQGQGRIGGALIR